MIDVITRLTSRCVELLGAAAAGILLADESGTLRVIGRRPSRSSCGAVPIQKSKGRARLLHPRPGRHSPGLACRSPWPAFARRVSQQGARRVCDPAATEDIVPRLPELFMSEPVRLSRDVAPDRLSPTSPHRDRAGSDESRVRSTRGQLQHALTAGSLSSRPKADREYGRIDMAARCLLARVRPQQQSGLTEVLRRSSRASCRSRTSPRLDGIRAPAPF